MKISPILSKNNFSPAFGEIIYKSFNPEYNLQKNSLKEEVDTFTLAKKNVKYLGNGLFADAYAFKKFPDIVIKKSNTGDDFSEEEKNLKLIASEIKNTQKFVARVYDDEEDEFYLLSTKVDGESPDPEDNPLTRDHIRNLFNTMFEMDDTGLYHGDLNNGNIKITPDGRVNLLDFQFSHQLDRTHFFDEKDKSTLPAFIMLENAQMLEQSGLPYYLAKINKKSDAKNFLKMYLMEKSNYHKKRYEFLNKEAENAEIYDKSNVWQSLKYEKARAKVFRNPSENVLRIETKKIQFLNSFREAYKRIDENVPHKNIIPAGTSYLVTLSNIQDFRKEVAMQKRQVDNSVMKDYLDGLEKYGDYWFEKIREWSDNAFWYPVRHAKNELSNWETKRYNFKDSRVDIEDFGAMTNVAGSVDDDYLPKYTKNFAFRTQYVFNNIGSTCEKINEIARLGVPPNAKEVYNNLCNVYSKLTKAFNQGAALDVINLSILCIVYADQLKEMVGYTSSIYFPATCIVEYCSDVAEACFKRAFVEISDDNPNSPVLTGYKSMGNFIC